MEMKPFVIVTSLNHYHSPMRRYDVKLVEIHSIALLLGLHYAQRALELSQLEACDLIKLFMPTKVP
jgi:hypothetical protein